MSSPTAVPAGCLRHYPGDAPGRSSDHGSRLCSASFHRGRKARCGAAGSGRLSKPCREGGFQIESSDIRERVVRLSRWLPSTLAPAEDENSDEVSGCGVTTYCNVGALVRIKVGIERRLADPAPTILLFEQVDCCQMDAIVTPRPAGPRLPLWKLGEDELMTRLAAHGSGYLHWRPLVETELFWDQRYRPWRAARPRSCNRRDR